MADHSHRSTGRLTGSITTASIPRLEGGTGVQCNPSALIRKEAGFRSSTQPTGLYSFTLTEYGKS
jgi:hypothetical protein